MERKRFVKISLEILSWVLLIVLSIGFVYFVREIWQSFVSGKTNGRVYSHVVESFQHPTITVCFEPQININVLMKYNLNPTDLLNIDRNPDVSVPGPIIDFVDNISYTIGRDFHIKLDLAIPHSKRRQPFVLKDDSNDENSDVKIEKLIGLYYGSCYMIKTKEGVKVPGRAQIYSGLDLYFKVINKTDLPLVKLIFTSEYNAYGSFWLQWMEGEKYELVIDPRKQNYHVLNLRQENQYLYEGSSDCSQNVSYYICVAKR